MNKCIKCENEIKQGEDFAIIVLAVETEDGWTDEYDGMEASICLECVKKHLDITFKK